jgi:hypothetical protein
MTTHSSTRMSSPGRGGPAGTSLHDGVRPGLARRDCYGEHASEGDRDRHQERGTPTAVALPTNASCADRPHWTVGFRMTQSIHRGLGGGETEANASRQWWGRPAENGRVGSDDAGRTVYEDVAASSSWARTVVFRRTKAQHQAKGYRRGYRRSVDGVVAIDAEPRYKVACERTTLYRGCASFLPSQTFRCCGVDLVRTW